ncbi:MAG TPA: DNA gyrase inhibitor YacG [Nitrospiria bacterium]|nr:DNA gyrase inhibitor YacG [Nitrospiria bacterium]
MSSAPLCPICRTRKADPAHTPFCSARCRDVDMGRWLSGAYRVPTEESASSETPDQTDRSHPSDDGDPVP